VTSRSPLRLLQLTPPDIGTTVDVDLCASQLPDALQFHDLDTGWIDEGETVPIARQLLGLRAHDGIGVSPHAHAEGFFPHVASVGSFLLTTPHSVTKFRRAPSVLDEWVRKRMDRCAFQGLRAALSRRRAARPQQPNGIRFAVQSAEV